MVRNLFDIASLLDLSVEGENVAITRPSLADDAGPGALTLATTDRYAQRAAERGAAALLAPPGVFSHLPTLRADRPRLAFARLLALFTVPRRPEPGIHPRAVVDAAAILGEGAAIGAFAVVEAGVRVGTNTIIGPHCLLESGVSVGGDSDLGPGVVLHEGTRVGDRVRIKAGAVIGGEGYGFEWDGERHVRVPHIGRVVIEDDVEIGSYSCVDRAKTGETRIGRGAKIDNLVQIGHGVSVGPHCLLVSQVGIAGSVVLEPGAVLAGQVGVADNVHIGAGAIVTAQSGVSGDIAGGETYMGYPLRPVAEARRIYAALVRLPDLVRRVRTLERRHGG